VEPDGAEKALPPNTLASIFYLTETFSTLGCSTPIFIPWAFPSAIWESQSGRWRPLGGKHVDNRREEGISLLLGLRPPDYRSKVLIGGGGHHNKNRMLLEILKVLGATGFLSGRSMHHASASVERIELTLDEPAWVADSTMQSPRLLPALRTESRRGALHWKICKSCLRGDP
jgi:hypothetical protein